MWPVWSSLGAGLILFWLATTISLWRRAPVAAFAMAWTLLTYLPSSNVVPLTKFFVAERYLYVPSFGVCLLGAILLERGFTLARRNRQAWLRIGVTTLTTALILAGAVRSVIRNRDWHDDVSLFSSALRDGFRTSRIHNNLGAAFLSQGKHDEALGQYALALQVAPGNPRPRINLASILLQQGRLDESALHCRLALEHAASGPYAASRRGFQIRGHLILAGGLRRQGRLAEAATHYKEVLAIAPNHFGALNDLAWLLATNPDPATRDGAEAIRLAQRAYQSKRRAVASTLDTLACAYAEAGRFEEAVETGYRAYEVAQARGQHRLAAEINDRIKQFRAGQPYHQADPSAQLQEEPSGPMSTAEE
jgi:tetratricopeptide (TPR) repeat protein